MKFLIIVATITCVLGDTLPLNFHPKAENAHSELMNYAQQQLEYVPMMRGIKFHLECYNGFLPLINSLAIKARDVSNGCVLTANFEKDLELKELKNSRLIVAGEVEKITTLLTDCSNMSGLDYFLCLRDNAEVNRVIMETVKEMSTNLMTSYNRKTKEIDSKEQNCIMRAIDNAKAETNHSFVDLKDCIRNGPVIQTRIDDVEDDENKST